MAAVVGTGSLGAGPTRADMGLGLTVAAGAGREDTRAAVRTPGEATDTAPPAPLEARETHTGQPKNAAYSAAMLLNYLAGGAAGLVAVAEEAPFSAGSLSEEFYLEAVVVEAAILGSHRLWPAAKQSQPSAPSTSNK